MKFKEFIKEYGWTILIIIILLLAIIFSIISYIKWDKLGFSWWFAVAGLLWGIFIIILCKK